MKWTSKLMTVIIALYVLIIVMLVGSLQLVTNCEFRSYSYTDFINIIYIPAFDHNFIDYSWAARWRGEPEAIDNVLQHL